MARIRSIKPEFFQHEGLFDLERSTGLPVRLAFIGLWGQADREGRFAWKARVLAANILPLDDVDFEAVLDALCDGGFIVKYSIDGKTYGAIPSWKLHQRPHQNETPSTIPPPMVQATCTNGANDSADGASHLVQEGEGVGKDASREGKGILEGEGSPPIAAKVQPLMIPVPKALDTPEFREAWSGWFDYLTQKGARPIQRTLELQLTDLARAGPSEGVARINQAITSGWIALPPLKGKGNGRTGDNPQRFDEQQPMWGGKKL